MFFIFSFQGKMEVKSFFMLFLAVKPEGFPSCCWLFVILTHPRVNKFLYPNLHYLTHNALSRHY